MPSDPLQRFIDAQRDVYAQVERELRAGRKETHWMWYIFPQIKGLGHSVTAQTFAIASIEEAVAYLGHPVLGSRLRRCTGLVNDLVTCEIEDVFGHPDHLKFHSSMTLFLRATADNAVFRTALTRFFDGQPDSRTLQILTSDRRRG